MEFTRNANFCPFLKWSPLLMKYFADIQFSITTHLASIEMLKPVNLRKPKLCGFIFNGYSLPSSLRTPS